MACPRWIQQNLIHISLLITWTIRRWPQILEREFAENLLTKYSCYFGQNLSYSWVWSFCITTNIIEVANHSCVKNDSELETWSTGKFITSIEIQIYRNRSELSDRQAPHSGFSANTWGYSTRGFQRNSRDWLRRMATALSTELGQKGGEFLLNRVLFLKQIIMVRAKHAACIYVSGQYHSKIICISFYFIFYYFILFKASLSHVFIKSCSNKFPR